MPTMWILQNQTFLLLLQYAVFYLILAIALNKKCKRIRSVGILLADLEKPVTRATSRAQSDGIQLKSFKKGALAYYAIVIVVLCVLVNKQDLLCRFILVTF